MSRKITITPVMYLETEIMVVNDRNASVAMVNLFDVDTGKVIANSTGASKREQFDTYNESVAVKLAVGRAFQKMSRNMISQAGREVRAAMTKAEDEAWLPKSEKPATDKPVFESPESLYRALTDLGLNPEEVKIFYVDE